MLTAGWVHKVLLLDWHRISRSCLVHLKQGLARVLPGGCLFDVAIRKQEERHLLKTVVCNKKKLESSNREALASDVEEPVTQS